MQGKTVVVDLTGVAVQDVIIASIVLDAIEGSRSPAEALKKNPSFEGSEES